MKNNTILLILNPNTLKKSRGGYSHISNLKSIAVIAMMLLFLGVGNAWGDKLCQSSYTGTIGALGSKTVYVSVGTIGTNMYRIVFESDFAMTGSLTYVNTSYNNNLCLDNATKTILDGGKIIYFDVPSTSAPTFKNSIQVSYGGGGYTLSGTAVNSVDWSQTRAECAILAGECTYTTNELILKVTTDGMTSTFELSHSSSDIIAVNNVNPVNLNGGSTSDLTNSGWTISDGKATKSITWSTLPTNNIITRVDIFANITGPSEKGGTFNSVDISCAASGSGGGGGARTYDGEEKMYFLRDAWDWWKNNGAKFYAYFWNSSTSEKAWSEAASWAVQTTSGNKDVWAYTVPAGTWDKVIITRGSGASFSDGKTWNKSNDITLESTTNLLTDWTVDGQTGHSITWSNITLGSKTVYFDNRNVTDWTTAYVRIGHGTSNSAWGTMSKVAGTRNLYSQTTSQWDYHSDFTIANAAGWQNQNIYQPWENQNWASGASGLQMTKQTNYQKYGIDRDVYICPASTSVSERDCQYYKVNNSTSSNTIDGDNQRMALPQYTVTASGTNCTVELVEYTNDALTTSQAITANKVDPTRYVGVTVTPSTGYEFGSVSLTSSAYETHTATAAGVTGKYAIMADCEISATCTPITYNITYKDQGNVAFSGSHANGYPETHTYGTATTLKTASKTGYTFGGWFANSTCTGSAVTSLGATAYTDDITLYAKWTVKTYSITLDKNHSGTGDNGSATVTYGSNKLTIISAPTRTGCHVNVYFRKYIEEGKNRTQTITSDAEGTLKRSTAYTDASYNWNYDGDVTLYTNWVGNDYDVTLNHENGTSNSTVQARYGSPMPTTLKNSETSVTIPLKDDYTFGGYYGAVGGGGTQYYTDAVASARTWNIANDATLYAKWTQSITLDIEGGESGSTSATVIYSSAKITLTKPTKTGYMFGGYYDGDDGTGNLVINTSKELQPNILGYTDESGIWINEGAAPTLYAKWTVKRARVYFDQNGGSGGQASYKVATYGEAMPTPITTPTRTGYEFGGYYDGEGGTGTKYYNSDGTSAQNWDKNTTSDTYLYAKWTVKTYTVTLDDGGAGTSVDPTELTATFGSSTITSITTNPAQTGYTFDGWYTGEGGKSGSKVIGTDGSLQTSVAGYTDGSGNWTHDDDVTLYAKWDVEGGGGGDCSQTLTASAGEAESYTLTTTKISSTQTKFVLSNASQCLRNGDLQDVAIENWGSGTGLIRDDLLLSWSSGANGSIEKTVTWTSYPTGKLKIYFVAKRDNSGGGSDIIAAWFDNIDASCEGGGTTYTVTYNANGADDGTAPVDAFSPYADGATVTVLGNKHEMTKDGYTFSGWTKNSSGTGKVYTEGDTIKSLSANTTLYAKWVDSSDPTLCSQNGDAGSGQTSLGDDKLTTFKDGYTFSVKEGATANHLTVSASLLDNDVVEASMGKIYLLFHSSASTLEEYDKVVLSNSGAVSVSNVDVDLNSLNVANDPILCMSIKFELGGTVIEGEVRITDRMYFDRENGGCTEPEEGETEAYFDIYHHDDAPEGARTSYEGGNIVVPIRYFRHFEHTGWCAISLPFKVSKVAVYDEDEKQEYDLYPRFTNNSGNVEGYYWLKTFSGNVSLSGFKPAWQQLTYPTNLTGATADEETTLAKNVKPAENTPYVIAFPDGTYYRKNWVIFYGEAFQTIDADFTGESSITLTDGYDYNQVQLQANNTMHASGTLNNIYMIEEGFDYFTRRESATVPAFEAYVIGTAEVQTRYSILRYTGEEENIPDVTDQPTGIENTPPTTAGYDGEVYTVAGIRVAGFANRDEMETLLNNLGAGVYVVRMGTQINKVVVY